MSGLRSPVLVIAASLLVAIVATGATAQTRIESRAIDLVDQVDGEDLIEIEYRVSGFDFLEYTAFAISFDYRSFLALEDPPPQVLSDWDVIVLQPDPLLLEDGIYCAMALVDNPNLSDTFVIHAVWIGDPGKVLLPQPFDILVYDEAGALIETLETGETIPVPEPDGPVLVSVALTVLAGISARGKNRMLSNLSEPGLSPVVGRLEAIGYVSPAQFEEMKLRKTG